MRKFLFITTLIFAFPAAANDLCQIINGSILIAQDGKCGPLSPVLSNIVLNNLDWELEKRNLRFARYADDCVVFVRSKAAGERVMKSLQPLLENHCGSQ